MGLQHGVRRYERKLRTMMILDIETRKHIVLESFLFCIGSQYLRIVLERTQGARPLYSKEQRLGISFPSNRAQR